MKKIIAWALSCLLCFGICACGAKDAPPHFKGLSWGDSLKDVQKVEKELKNEGEYWASDDTTVPFSRATFKVIYTFEDNGLSRILATSIVGNEDLKEIEAWLDEYYEFQGSGDKGDLYFPKSKVTTALLLDAIPNFATQTGPDGKTESVSLISLDFNSYNPPDDGEKEEKDTSDSENWKVKTYEEAEAIVRQTVINECCRYSNVKSVLGLDIGNQEYVGTEKLYGYANPMIMYNNITGSYYPKDNYGDLGDEHYFDMTIYVDAVTGEGMVISSNIREYK